MRRLLKTKNTDVFRNDMIEKDDSVCRPLRGQPKQEDAHNRLV